MVENDLAWKLVELLSGKMAESAIHELRHNPHSLEPFRAAVKEIAAVEREACASTAEGLAFMTVMYGQHEVDEAVDDETERVRLQIAFAIRLRGL